MANGISGGMGGRTGRFAAEAMNVIRRVNHGGGSGWHFRNQQLRQPQDGAPEAASQVTEITTRLGQTLISEPEDARLTGGTRSLARRLLGLNVLTPKADPPPVSLAPKVAGTTAVGTPVPAIPVPGIPASAVQNAATIQPAKLPPLPASKLATMPNKRPAGTVPAA